MDWDDEVFDALYSDDWDWDLVEWDENDMLVPTQENVPIDLTGF